MKLKTVPHSWLQRDGRRLDCGPYMSGALEAKVRLETLKVRKERLGSLTKGHNGGIFNGPQFSRTWAESEDYGVPFVGSSSMLMADLTDLPLLRKKDAQSSKLSYLRLDPQMTLISCSGTIGRMVYVRPDMAGIWSSQDIMKVAPNPEKIPPGYLYAYLSSKFGIPLIVGGTYGAIIQHIEPHHIADLPVPRLGETVERRVHDLMEDAARKRTQAAKELTVATRAVVAELQLPQPSQKKDMAWWGHGVPCSELNRTRRFEAYFHNPVALRLDDWISRRPEGHWRLRDVADVFDVPPFKHIYVGPEHGLPFYTSGALFRLERSADKHLSKTRTKDLHKYVLKKGWVLLARSGQLGGIIGRPQFADSALNETTTSDHVIRIVPRTELITAGFLYAYLATEEIGYPLLTRTMTGASVPALWPTYLNDVRVVKAGRSFMEEIDEIVQQAFEMRIAATVHETDARRIVEQAIEQAS